MAETIDQVSERLTALEVTVAQGFHDSAARDSALGQRIDINSERLTALEVTVAQGFHDGEARDSALSRKIDVNTESLRADLTTVLDAVTSLADEVRRTTDAIRKEHAADRVVVNLALELHARRLHDVERTQGSRS